MILSVILLHLMLSLGHGRRGSNAMVLSWIHQLVFESILQYVLYIDKASEVWKNLNDRFAKGDIFDISDLLEEIFKLVPCL